jgi:hypothetical protein
MKQISNAFKLPFLCVAVIHCKPLLGKMKHTVSGDNKYNNKVEGSANAESSKSTFFKYMGIGDLCGITNCFRRFTKA